MPSASYQPGKGHPRVKTPQNDEEMTAGGGWGEAVCNQGDPPTPPLHTHKGRGATVLRGRAPRVPPAAGAEVRVPLAGGGGEGATAGRGGDARG